MSYFIIGTIVILILLAWVVWAYGHRDPHRRITPQGGYYSPADGIVAQILLAKDAKFIPKGKHGIRTTNTEYMHTYVVIKMYPWHVHVQRAPTNATITYLHHKPGLFLNAVNKDYDKATAENEHLHIVGSGKKPWHVYLIAGFLARRIRWNLKKGDTVSQGDRISKILFGSQVVLGIPHKKVVVEVGEKVTAGVTIIAK